MDDLKLRCFTKVQEAPLGSIICPDPIFFEPTVVPELPEILTSYTDARSRCHISVDYAPALHEHGVVSSYVTNQRITIPVGSHARAKHNIVFRMFNSTPSKLADIQVLGDQSDRLEPDMIEISGSDVVVIEFATTNTGRSDHLRNIYDTKVDKYLEQLRRRSKDRRIGMFIVVVSNNRVFSNLDMDGLMVSQLIHMQRVMGAAIRRIMMENPDVPEPDDEYQQHLLEFEEKLANYTRVVRNVSKDKQYLTEELFEEAEALRTQKAGRIDVQKVRECLVYANKEVRSNFLEVDAEDEEKKIHSYFSYDFDAYKHRQDRKTVVQFPFLCVRPFKKNTAQYGKTGLSGPTDIPEGGASGICDPELNLWLSAIAAIQCGSYERIKDTKEDVYLDPSKTLDELLEQSEKDKETRRQYNRINLDITDSEWQKLAIYGLRGKQYSQDPDVQMARLTSKKRFHQANTPVDDIENIIEGGCPYFEEDFANCWDEEVENLYMSSVEEHAQNCPQAFTAKLQEDIRHLCRSRGMNAMRVIREICHEILISRRQHCKDKEFIIKRLRSHPIWLLLHTTCSRSHTFFSVMTYNDFIENGEEPYGLSGVFRNMRTNGTISYTQFVSILDPKLVFPAYADTKYMVFYRAHQEIAEVKPENTCRPLPKPHGAHFLMHLLIGLSGKQGAADAACLVRYLFMKSCSIERARPSELLRKFNSNPKGRLEVYINRKIESYMRHILRFRVSQRIDSDSSGSWDNIVSWITLTPLRTPRQAINYSYHGYSIGTCKHIDANSLGTLCENTAEHEDDLPKRLIEDVPTEPKSFRGKAQKKTEIPDTEGLGTGDKSPEDIGFHEYNRSLAYSIFKSMDNYLTKHVSVDYREMIKKELLHELCKGSVEEMATLKSSSKFGQDFYSWPFEETYHREKVISAISKIVKQEKVYKIIDMVKYSLDFFTADERMHLCLFPKDQTTGTREIYVMTIEGRILQKLIEKFARIMCSLDPNEIMMHPDNKFQLLHDFQSSISASNKKFDVLCTSADKKRWNHGNHVSKFILMVNFFAPPEFAEVFNFILSLWDERRIMVPEKLIKSLRASRNEDISTNSDIVNAIHAGLWGAFNYLMDGGKTYMKISHGFMQGLLHYCSSVFHGCFLKFLVSLFHAQFRELKSKGRVSPNAVFKVLTMHSSDDSAFAFAISYENDEERRNNEVIMRFFDKQAKELGRLLGLYESEKTAHMCRNIIEFNSKFTFGTSTEEPLLRHLNAVIQSSDQESLYGRQDEAYSNLGQCIEHGASFWLTAHLQAAQCIAHYQALGSTINFAFPQFFQLIRNVQDPSLGYFLVDDPRMTGLMGIKYSAYLNSFKPSVSSRLKAFLIASEEGAIPKAIAMGLSKGKNFLGSTTISFGCREKAKRAFKASELPADWRESLNKNPAYLYSKPSNYTSLLWNLAKKFHQPGVITSFAHGASNQMFCLKSSPYTIQRLVATQVNLDLTDDDEAYKRLRTSIMRELYQYYRDGDDFVYGHGKLTDDERAVLFPRMEDYKSVMEKLRSLGTVIIPSALRDARKRVKCPVFSIQDQMTINLCTCAKVIWGFAETHHSEEEVNRCWTVYKTTFSWLRDTHDSTLKISPFRDAVELANFINNFSSERRVVQMSTAPMATRTGRVEVIQAVRYHYFHSHQLSTELAEPRPEDDQDIMHELICASTLPFVDDLSQDLVTTILKHHETVTADIRGLNRNSALRVLQQWAKREFRSCIFSLQALRDTCLGTWIIPQTRNQRGKYVGIGTWEGEINNRPIRVNVEGDDSGPYITRITVRDRRDVLQMLEGMASFVRTNKMLRSHRFTVGNRNVHVITDLHGENREGFLPWTINSSLTTKTINEEMLSNSCLRVTPQAIKLIGPGDATIASLPLDSSCYLHRPYLSQSISHWRRPIAEESEGDEEETSSQSSYHTAASGPDQPLFEEQDSSYQGSVRMIAVEWINNEQLTIHDWAECISNEVNLYDRKKLKAFFKDMTKACVQMHGITNKAGQELEVPDAFAANMDMIEAQFDEDMNVRPDMQLISELAFDAEALGDVIISSIDELAAFTGFKPMMRSLEIEHGPIMQLHPAVRSFLNSYDDIRESWYDVCINGNYVIGGREEELARLCAKIRRMQLWSWIKDVGGSHMKFRPRSTVMRRRRRVDPYSRRGRRH